MGAFELVLKGTNLFGSNSESRNVYIFMKWAYWVDLEENPQLDSEVLFLFSFFFNLFS